MLSPMSSDIDTEERERERERWVGMRENERGGELKEMEGGDNK
jgi:hypothetical protein